MPSAQNILPLIVFIPFAAAALALVIGRFAGRRTGLLMVAAAAAAFSMAAWALGHPPADGPAVFSRNWFDLGDLLVNLRFRADGFGLFFAMLIAGIGTLVGIYSLGYIGDLPNSRLGRYYAALIAFMGAMLGIALADDMMLMFVFWEITSITSFMLIGYWYEQDIAKKGALTALQVTALGGLAMMAGFVLIAVVTGTFTISEVAASAELQAKLAASPVFLAAMLLILGGAFTKSAQVPFHFWLPGAMVAPTPVSTYLHAATMVKAGIFLLGRMLPVFAGAAAWSPIVTTVGLITFVLSAYQALRESDLKAILARTTLSTLGLITMLYGLKAADQDTLQIFSHAAYKGTLFLVAGIVEHAAHTRDIRKLGGLKKYMPITFWLCVLGALSMAGLPPFFGFLAKESLYHELLHSEVLHSQPLAQWLVIAGSVTANAFVFAVSFKLIFGIFLGEKPQKLEHVHEAGALLWAPALVLGALALVMGLLGAGHLTEHVVNALSSDSAAAMHVSLVPSLEHPGPLVLSVVTIALGILIYRGREAVNAVQQRLDVLPAMQAVWDRTLAGMTWFAVAFSSRWQNGSLRWYFSGTLVFAVVLSMLAMRHGGISLNEADPNMAELPWYGVALGVLLIIATVAMVRSTTRLGSAIALTSIGFLVALMYVVYRSPDILLTQILIETVSTIFILLVLFFMPAFKRDMLSPAKRIWNLAVSCAVGLMMFTFVLLCTSPHLRETNNLGQQYLSKSLTLAGGRNAVNVIIVDFRAMDTTGEITVLVVVGLCVYGLLRTRRRSA